MTTRPDVINAALVECGQPPMNGPSDTSTWVQRISSRYAPAVKMLLEKHPWNFATVRFQLSALPDTPIGRAYAYNKPGNVLRLITVNTTGEADDNANLDYEDEGGSIMTDWSPCYIRYVSAEWMTKEGAWPQVFADAVSAELATRCYALFGKSSTEKDRLRGLAAKALQAAKSWDAAQMPARRIAPGSWVRARRARWSPDRP